MPWTIQKFLEYEEMKRQIRDLTRVVDSERLVDIFAEDKVDVLKGVS